MQPLWLQIVIGVVGLGIPKAVLDYYYRDRFSEIRRWVIAVSCLVVCLCLANYYAQLQNRPRHLSPWQVAALKHLLSHPDKDCFIEVYSAPGDTEAFNYAQEITPALAATGLIVAHDAPTRKLALRGDAVVVPAANEWWLEQTGLVLCVSDLNAKPASAVQLMNALTAVGLSSRWQLDLQLSKTNYGGVAAPGEKDEVLLYVGQKPEYNLFHSFRLRWTRLSLWFES